MLSVKNQTLTKSIADSGILNTATALFVKFPSNNIYGNLYLKIAKGVVNSANDNLVEKFMGKDDGYLLNSLSSLIESRHIDNHPKVRKQSMGQVIAILRELRKTERETAIKLRDNHEKWEYIDEEFLPVEIELQDRDNFKDTLNVLDKADSDVTPIIFDDPTD